MRFLKANKVFNGLEFIENDLIVVLDSQNNFVEYVSESNLRSDNIESFDGILCPGFINAHCHLELSHLVGKIKKHIGLPAFAKEIIQIRASFSEEIAIEKMTLADKWMFENGIVAVGDICNNSTSFTVKNNSLIYYHSFIELIGLNPKNADGIFENGKNVYKNLVSFNLNGSLAPHAPYSVSNKLIQLISEFNALNNKQTSIHNQESLEELKFFMGVKNGFDDLFAFLKMDMNWYKAPNKTSLQNYLPLIKKDSWILVHNTFTNTEDVEASALKNVFWCFCPTANLYIENHLPNFEIYKNYLNRICVGTDSLASNENLDIIKELNIISNNSKYTTEQLLKAITYNGAKALEIERLYGSFIPKKNAGINLISLHDKQFKFLKKIA
jgi:cytosine/adenosine deaminase-related metal-dependent hydrolase